MLKIINISFGVLLILIGFQSNSQSQQSAWTGNFNFSLGSGEWEHETKYGIEIDFKNQSWPISIAIDLLRSVNETVEYSWWNWRYMDVEYTVSEFNIGARQIWSQYRNIRPFFGSGLTFINVERKVSGWDYWNRSSIEDKFGIGYWMGGGIYWKIGNHFNIGLEGKYSSAYVDFDESYYETSEYFGILFGYHW